MGLLGGGALRLFQTLFYAIAFCVSAIPLGFYSYFLAVLSDRNLEISNRWKTVEGISGVAVLYTILAVIFTCCLGGISFFGFIAIIFNLLFMLAFIAVAILTRDGAGSCSGDVVTPIGTGPSNLGVGWDSTDNSGRQYTYAVKLGTACNYNKASFACALIAIFVFLILAIFQIFLVRHHRKEKRYGPSPNNGYTAGSGKRRFWQRKNRSAVGAGATAGGLSHAEKGHVDTRPSHDTAYTGSTVAPAGATGLVTEPSTTHGHSAHGRYYTQPEGTGVNPYGYENGTATHGTAPARNF